MDLSPYFKSIVDQERDAIVICDLNDVVIYMNPAAKISYHKHNNGDLVGRSLLACHNAASCEAIENVKNWFLASESHNLIYTFHNEKQNKDVYMVALRDGNGSLIGYYEKHEFRNPETMKRYDFTE